MFSSVVAVPLGPPRAPNAYGLALTAAHVAAQMEAEEARRLRASVEAKEAGVCRSIVVWCIVQSRVWLCGCAALKPGRRRRMHGDGNNANDSDDDYGTTRRKYRKRAPKAAEGGAEGEGEGEAGGAAEGGEGDGQGGGEEEPGDDGNVDYCAK
jgi:hypothetical protein